MRLSEVVSPEGMLRDAEFNLVGLPRTQSPGLLTFAVNATYLRLALSNSNVSCVVTTAALVDQVPPELGVVFAENPRDTFYEIHESVLIKVASSRDGSIGTGCRIHSTAVVSPGARIGERVSIGEFVVIRDNVTIGNDCVIESGVKIGVNGILHRESAGLRKLIPHGGSVLIQDGVVLMTNAVVARAVFPGTATMVGKGSVIGLNSVVGHDANVRERCVISNNCVIARGALVGPNAFLGTGSVIREFTNVGKDSQVLAGSIVVSDVEDGDTVSGNFAYSHVRRMRETRYHRNRT